MNKPFAAVFDKAGIAVGDELPILTKAPITRTTLAYFCGASNDHNPLHVDINAAKAAGMEDVFVHGMLNMAYVGQMLTQWLPQQYLRCFEVKFGAIVHLGDELSCKGVIDERFEQAGEDCVRIRLSVHNQHDELKLTGEAVMALPNSKPE
ncbi:MAG: MaoC/PaaZ C-terminal domain-containing protein [Porticoccaceae bacterium]